MTKPVPEIRTKFSLRGLAGAAAALRKFGDMVARVSRGIMRAAAVAGRVFSASFRAASRIAGGSVNDFWRKFDRMSNAVVRGAIKAGLALANAFGALARAAVKALIRVLQRLVATLLAVAAAMRRAFGAAVKASILSTAAAIRRVTSALHSVTRAATVAGAKLALISAGILAILTAVSVAAKAASVALAGVAGLAAGALVGGGSVALATSTATDQAKRADASGTSSAGVVGIAGAATQLGVETTQAEGWLGSLQGKLSDAANGGESAAFFGKLRIDATDASDGIRDTVSVLEDLDRTTAGMSKAKRRSVFAELFGDDADDIMSFLDRGGLQKISAAKKRAEGFGAIATPADIGMVRDFKSSIQDLVLSLRGMALAISRRILPGITATTRGLAAFISANREIFANYFAAGWGRIMKAMGGAVGILRIIPLAAGAVVRSMHSLLGVMSDVGKYLAGDFGGIERTWVYELTRAVHATIKVFSTLADLAGGGIISALSRGWVGFLYIVVEIIAAFKGLDHVVRDGWILTMRDGIMAIIGVIQQIPAFIQALPQHFEAAKKYVLEMVEAMRVAVVDALILVLTTGMQYADAAMAMVEARVAALYARAAEAVRPYIDAIKDVFELLRDGAGAKTESPWILEIRDQLISARQVALDFWESLKTAWGWFKGVLDVIHSIVRPILAFFGTDILTMVLFVGMLRMSGLLGLMVGTVKLLGGALRWAFGGEAASLATGFVALCKKAWTYMGSMISKLAAAAPGLVKSAGKLIPGAGMLYSAYEIGAGIGEYGAQKLYNGLGYADEDRETERMAMASAKVSQERSYDERMASLASVPNPTGVPRKGWANPWTRPDGSIDGEALWAVAGRGRSVSDEVNVNFQVGAKSSTLSGTRDAVDSLVRSLNDTRQAGGIR